MNLIFMNNSILKKFIILWYSLSFYLAMTSNSNFCIWMTMEFNLMSFFILLTNKINYSTISSLMKYFIIQSMTSSILLFLLIMKMMMTIETNTLIIITLWLKSGLFPFNYWYFQITENLDWLSWVLLNTAQKLLPLFLWSAILTCSSWALNCLILLNSIYASIEIYMQSSYRWIMNCSSLNHFSWIFISFTNNNSNIWCTYYMIYTINSFLLFKIFNKFNTISIFNLITNMNITLFIMINFVTLNFLGVPPFLGFLPKLMILMKSMNVIMNLSLVILLMPLVLTYLMFMMPLMTKMNIIKNINNKTNKFYTSFMSLHFLMMMMYM
uniref:NADH dehydrogenase subunit 2 n=1 Tax=Neoseiulus chebalingensis TaxID=3061192 RepID=UPI0030FE9C46